MNDEILTRYLLGETSEEENRTIRTWIAENPDHQKHYNHFKLIWETSKEVAKISTVDPDEAWNRFREKRPDSIRSGLEAKKNRIQILRGSRIAAGFLIATFVAFIIYFLLLSDSGRLVAVHFESGNSPRTETLADGSVITLNKNSDLSFSQTLWKDKRTVNMKTGEAFFQVRHDRSKPFIVHTKDVTITVLGTSFNIKNTARETEIIVKTGRVKVESGKDSTELTPGKKVIIDHSDGAFNLEEVRDELYGYYINNKFELNNTPLWRVAEVLESVYGQEIIVREELRDLPLTTTLEVGSLDSVLNIIAETFRIRVVKRSDQVILQ